MLRLNFKYNPLIYNKVFGLGDICGQEGLSRECYNSNDILLLVASFKLHINVLQ